MSEPADLTPGILLRVAEFLRKLPADQLADLASGEAKLELVPRGGRRPGRTGGSGARSGSGRAGGVVAPSADRVRAELTAIGDRAGARRWLEDQGFTVAQLKALAKDLDITVPSRATKPVFLDQIVQWTVGRRLDAESISRPAPSRA